MRPWLLSAYHHLPAPARTLAVAARGFVLRSWRYGPETDRLVAEAAVREAWNEREWSTWREERLARLLGRAATRVPSYRRFWEGHGGGPESWMRLESWPVLEKGALRGDPRGFLADDCRADAMFHEHTSGTSGSPLDLWWSRETVRQWYALFERRWRQWYGVSRDDRWALFGGQLVVPVRRHRPPFWTWNPALRQLYCSSYHLSPRSAEAYLDALLDHRVTYLWGYPSALNTLAVAADGLGRGRELGLRVAIANAEPLLDSQRAAIEAAFGSPVRETYGMAEIVAAAGECEEGRLHLWPDAGIVEVMDGDRPLPPGKVGDLVCTGLVNADMPLVRYRLGDRGALSGSTEACPCGRRLPLLSRLEGRCDDVLTTADGRQIGRLDPVFKRDLRIVEAQVVQETLHRIRIRLVPSAGFGSQDERALREALCDRLGLVDVVFERLERIPREPSGKFRAVVSMIAPVQGATSHATHRGPA